MTDYKNYILKRFSFISKIYDIFLIPTTRLREEVLSSYNFKEETKVLEVGTGTGNLSIDVSKFSKNVFACDISFDMLKKAVKKKSPVKFLIADGTKLPFKEKEFDISIVATVLHEIPVDVIEKILEEMKRVTKNSIIIVDYSISNPIIKFFVNLYESKFFKEFISLNMKKVFDKLNLNLVSEKKFLSIFKLWKLDANN